MLDHPVVASSIPQIMATSKPKVVKVNDDNLFAMNGAAKKDVVMKNGSTTASEEKNEAEKTSADYYFDSYSHFGTLYLFPFIFSLL